MKKIICVFLIILCFYPSISQTRLKVITYNIFNGFDWGKDTLRKSNFEQWIKKQNPDILAMQELCAYTPEKLAKQALAWQHPYSALLKSTGYSVGITSKYPIIVKEKLFNGLHHGALWCEINHINYLVVHLHPGSIQRRREESQILLKKIEGILNENKDLIVLGDFNSHSPFDADLYEPNGFFISDLRKRNAGKGLNGNILETGLDYSVQSAFLSSTLEDVVQRFTKGIAERGSFPALILGRENKESEEQMNLRLERIDYILVSPQLSQKCVNAKVFNGLENAYLSDHYPVMAEFNLSK